MLLSVLRENRLFRAYFRDVGRWILEAGIAAAAAENQKNKDDAFTSTVVRAAAEDAVAASVIVSATAEK